MDKMLSKDDFLIKYNYTKEQFDKTALDWGMLEKIFDSYIEELPHLEASAAYVSNGLMKTKNVHSVRYRVKDPEHVIEKIIRKTIANPSLNITLENYREKLTDLIGLRALHLFKEEWLPIHYSITKTWNLLEPGVINFRDGDKIIPSEELKEFNLTTKQHEFGYRSIHYIIETKPAKQIYYAEIQVRTIFEEAWSEIDHTIRYPYDQNNVLFGQYLMILNRLAGSADEMGTFISLLKESLKQTDEIHEMALAAKDTIIEDLQKKINKMKIEPKDSKFINESLQKLRVRVAEDFQTKSISHSNSVADWLNNHELPSVSDRVKLYDSLNKANRLVEGSLSSTLRKILDVQGQINKASELGHLPATENGFDFTKTSTPIKQQKQKDKNNKDKKP